jgi:hypothetical protein
MDLVIQLYRYTKSKSDTPQNVIGKERRQFEINDCLIRNIKNKIFLNIHVLFENADDLEYYNNLISDIPERYKLIPTIFGKQPLYSDIVRYINMNIKDDISVCIMNSDIFMGSVAIEFINKELTYNTFISLTRHEYTDDTHSVCNVNTCHLIYKYHGSHDAFIFKTPVPYNYNYDYINIPQNVGGSEAIFMKSWNLVGKQLKNLCFDIPIYHRHANHFYISAYKTLATHELCNVSPTVPEGRSDIQSQMIKMF